MKAKRLDIVIFKGWNLWKLFSNSRNVCVIKNPSMQITWGEQKPVIFLSFQNKYILFILSSTILRDKSTYTQPGIYAHKVMFTSWKHLLLELYSLLQRRVLVLPHLGSIVRDLSLCCIQNPSWVKWGNPYRAKKLFKLYHFSFIFSFNSHCL